MRARQVGVVAVLVAALGTGVTAPGGAATRPAVATKLARAWTVKVGDANSVAPVIYRGRAFTTDYSRVTAVDIAGGSVQWQVNHDDSGFGPVDLGPPSLVRGEIWTPWYFGGRYGGVYAHDPKTGTNHSTDSPLTVGHVVTHKDLTAYVWGAAIPGTILLALEYGGLKSGLIDVSGSLQSYTDPVFATSRHVWVGYGASLMRFDPSGKCVKPPQDINFCMPNRKVPLDGSVVGIAAGPDNPVVATTASGVVEVHDGDTGAELWRATPGSQPATPTVSSDLIVVGAPDGFVHAYDANGCGAALCAPLWSGDAGAGIATSPAIGNGLVFVGTTAGTVVAFVAAGCGDVNCDPTATGVVKTQSPITGGPVFGQGSVVVGTADGHLTAFRSP